MKLVFTDEAKADLLQIGEWIAEDNPARAFTFVNELKGPLRPVDRDAARLRFGAAP
jgi:plasmid stabilization system protein ParE